MVIGARNDRRAAAADPGPHPGDPAGPVAGTSSVTSTPNRASTPASCAAASSAVSSTVRRGAYSGVGERDGLGAVGVVEGRAGDRRGAGRDDPLEQTPSGAAAARRRASARAWTACRGWGGPGRAAAPAARRGPSAWRWPSPAHRAPTTTASYSSLRALIVGSSAGGGPAAEPAIRRGRPARRWSTSTEIGTPLRDRVEDDRAVGAALHDLAQLLGRGVTGDADGHPDLARTRCGSRRCWCPSRPARRGRPRASTRPRSAVRRGRPPRTPARW